MIDRKAFGEVCLDRIHRRGRGEENSLNTGTQWTVAHLDKKRKTGPAFRAGSPRAPRSLWWNFSTWWAGADLI